MFARKQNNKKPLTSRNSKYILACGCSFTQSYLISPCVPREQSMFTRWPELLGQKLGREVKNLAESGRGNNWIYRTLIGDIIKNHDLIDMVVVGWSEPSRYDIWGIQFTPLADTYNRQTEQQKKLWAVKSDPMIAAEEQFHEQLFESYVWDYWHIRIPHILPMDNILTAQILDTLKYMLQIQELCKIFNIPLIQSSMLGMIDPHQIHFRMARSPNRPPMLDRFVPKDMINHIITKEEFLSLEPKYNMGYPFMKDLGGFDFHHDIIHSYSGLQVHDQDPHPNEAGHKLIAEMYYEHYKKNFT